MPQTTYSVEITTSTGRSYRWSADAKNVSERPQIGSWGSQIGDGWGPCTVTLHRRTDVPWADLGLMDTLRVRAADGSVVYEGRIESIERASGRQITLATVGWATYLRSRPFCEIYVDRDPSSWGSPSLALRLAQIAADRVMDLHYTAEATGDSLRFSGTKDENIPTGSRAILQYTAPSGCLVSRIDYEGEERNIAAAQEEDPTLYATDNDGQVFGSWTAYALTLDATTRQRVLTTARRFLALMLNAASTHPPTTPAHRTYKKIAVYGDHDVEPRDNGAQPDGVYASEVIEDVLARFAPKVALETSGTSYPISHLAFHEPTTPYDAIVRCNEFHHWNFGVYAGPTLIFEPIDMQNADWIVREDWQGVTVGDAESATELVNGVPVSYEDVETGRTEILWPTDHEELRDDSEENPANRWGESKWAETFSVPFPCTDDDALQLGGEHLLDLNTPRRPGPIQVPRRIKDARGNWRAVHEVRSGQTVEVTTRPELGVRLITSTSFDPETNMLDISTDYDVRTLDAFLARLESARVGRVG